MANNLPWINLLGLAVGGLLAKNESLLKLMVSILQWLLFDGCGEVDLQVRRCVAEIRKVDQALWQIVQFTVPGWQSQGSRIIPECISLSHYSTGPALASECTWSDCGHLNIRAHQEHIRSTSEAHQEMLLFQSLKLSLSALLGKAVFLPREDAVP